MSNPIYALTDHDHTEEELAPWLAECGTGDPIADGLVLTALDCAWGHWERAVKEPRQPFSDRKMKDITLGKCPFCGGKVTSAVESRHKGALVAYWCVRPVCENGCPVGKVADGWDDLHVGYGGDPGPDVVGTDLANKWGNVCDTLAHPRPCPHCGDRPMFAAVRATLCFGCPSDGLVKFEAGTTLLGLVVKWNGEADAAESAGRRQAELEEECGILNRAFWPERLKLE